MHSYSTDGPGRIRGVAICALVSAGIVVATQSLHEAVVPQHWWWSPIPSLGLVFTGVFGTVERWGWKMPVIRSLLGINTPNLAGRWEGNILSSYDDHDEAVPITVEVRQTWFRISIYLQTENSSSESLTASMLVNGSHHVRLSYEYENNPDPDSPKTMSRHLGTAVLRNREEANLEGYYYSDQHRQQAGRIKLTRVEE